MVNEYTGFNNPKTHSAVFTTLPNTYDADFCLLKEAFFAKKYRNRWFTSLAKFIYLLCFFFRKNGKKSVFLDKETFWSQN